MTESSGGQAGTDGGGTISNQLALLVPSFDPASDNVDIWSSKVHLLLEAWPQTKILELITRLILNTKGSAYQKLHLHQKDLLVNDRKGVQKLVELVGGTWGQIPLEHRFELVEKALYRCQQKPDETGDSFIARVDVVWTELLTKDVDMDQIRSYVLLRGSRLSAEDKKRVLVESGAEQIGQKLEWKKVVAAIRMLGSSFFQDYTGAKREKNMKTYDHLAFNVDEVEEDEEHDTYWTVDDPLDDETLAQLANDNDEDAAMVVQFEDAVTEAVQSDADLAAYFSSYQEARRRLTERAKFRGFWPVRKGGKSGGKKGFGKGGGKGKSLAQRIANSTCRLCGKKGHWKAECSLRQSASSTGPPSDGSTVPISMAVVDDVSAEIPPEIFHLPEMRFPEPLPDCAVACFGVITGNKLGNNWNNDKGKKWGFKSHVMSRIRVALRNELSIRANHRDAAQPKSHDVKCPSTSHMHDPKDHPASSVISHDIHFASSGTHGIVDLGASQTVIGSHQVTELLQGLPEQIRKQAHRAPCHLVFRFGNHQTLTSQHALVLPIQKGWFRIAVVPGPTPFLLSSAFLKQIQAVIDTEEGTMWSKALRKFLTLERSPKNLFLMNLNQLWDDSFSGESGEASCMAQTEIDRGAKMTVKQPQGSLRGSELNLTDQSSPLESSVSCHETVLRTHLPVSPSPSCPTDSAVCGPKINAERDSTPGEHDVPGFAAQGVQQVAEEADLSRGRECHDSGRVSQREDHLRRVKEGYDLCSGVRGRTMDRVHFEQVRDERQTRAHDVCAVCPSAPEGCPGEDQNQQPEPQAEREQEHASRSTGGLGRCHADGRLRSSRPDAPALHSGGDARSTTEQPASVQSNGTSRDDDARDAGAHEEDAGEIRELRVLSATEADLIRHGMFAEEMHLNMTLDTDFDFTHDVSNNSYHRRIQRMVKQFQSELDQVIQQNQKNKFRLPQLDLFEVMCSSDSELTKQMSSIGGRSKRFGLAEGDLQTAAGRRRMFQVLTTQNPKNLWYSPECGPWVRGHGSVWKPPIGLMGRNKSLHGLHDILQKRLASLWQISLAIVLYRFQVQRSLHFHLEQPDGSKMLQLQPLSEIGEHTRLCRFDLCRMGNLTDPESAMPIRKRLNVATTSDPLARAIHGKLCNSDHEHRQIAGSIKHEGKRMSLSTFTEKYPAKFARQVVKILLYEVPKEKPVFAMDDPPSQENNNEHPTKKRRLMSKLSPQAIAQRFADASWQTVMRRANVMAPRVGPLVIDTGEIIHEISMLCPEHEIKHVVLCRGTDRYPDPTRNVPPGSAPLRKRICIRRKHEDVVVDDEWEPWEKLTFKGLRRKGTPARVSLTIFAKAKTVVGQEIPVSEHVPVQSQSSADVRAVRSAEFEGSEPEPKRPRTYEPMDVAQRVSEPEKTESIDRHVIDLASQKHGPRFMMLKPETQAWLLKVHRNLGHPGAMKLTEFCRQLGCPSEILQAIGDLKCSTCAENQDPKIARPSSIHDHGDFGDVVAIDGITWTNKMGQQYNIYHMLDQSTLYHTAVVTRAHDAEQAIHALHQGWIQWAGPPGLLCMDAGTELNSNDFMTFLQRYSIKHRTIATEAHWQNSRIERHGAVLQSILNKMDTEEPLDSFEKVSQATALATATKNQWSRHRGYPPEVLVFGKSSRVAGSVVSDMQLPSHSLAIDDRPEGLRFREELALRERARRAFTATDNCQVLRRALVQRSRPNRGKYVQGDHVMMWRKRGEADGSWIGPLRVVLQESSHVVWITMGSKLYRVAPEHLRPLSAVEEWQHRSTINENQSGDSPRSTSPNQSIIPPHGGVQYHNLIPTEAPSSTTTANNQDVNQIPIIPNEDNPNVSVIPISDSNSEQPDGEPVPNNQDPSENVEQPPNPVEVPIPDTDDELFVEADHVFQVDNDQCWKLEIPICAQDSTRWREETKPQEMAFLVSAAKRQRSEVKLSDLTAEDRERFRQAKMKEVESWISTETITKIMRNQIPKANILRSRWILTWKEVDPTADQPQQSQKMKPKARLVVLGFEDPEVSEIPRDSPTMNKLTRMLLLQYCASRKWDIQSFDVQTAFLRGSEQSNRVLGMEPPEEMRQKLKLRQDEVVQLLKGAYGRVDAPYLWFVELKKTLEELGFQASPFDPCLFHLSDPKTQETQGLIGVHVDDGLCCGNETFQNKLKQLEAKFPFGSRKMHKFVFTGLHVTQEADYTITVNQSQYVRDIHAISISRDRRCQPDTVVTEEERQALRALIGSLQYAAVNTRPDICSRLGWLQSQINKAKVSTLVEANRTLHEAKQHSNVALRIQSIPVPDLRFVAFSDASFASEKCPDSHQGMMIMSAHKCIGENRRSPINPMVWHSKKIQKVAVSTLSAEAMALAGAVDMLSWVRLFWAWICDHRCDWRQADSTLSDFHQHFQR